MLRRLSQIYGVPFSENRGKALITSLAGALIPTSSGIGAADALKVVPVVGTIISALVTPVLAAGAAYAIGKVFIQHFASGGTLLDFNPPDYREFLKGQKEMWVKRSHPRTLRSPALLGTQTRLRGRLRPVLDLEEVTLPIRLLPIATSARVRPRAWTFTSVAIFGSHNHYQSSSDFSPTTRPAPPTWRRLAGAAGLFVPIVGRRESRSALQIVPASCAAASAAVTPD